MRKWTAVALSLAVFGAGCAASDNSLAICGAQPSDAFLTAARDAGFATTYDPKALPADAAAACIVTPCPDANTDLKAVAAAAKHLLSAGKLVIVALGDNANQAHAFQDFLPVNLWTTAANRPGSGLAPANAEFCANFDLSTALLGSRIDLHLPFAPIEAGEHRYQWKTYGKDILNTDWKVLARTARDGRLPVLIQSRFGPGMVVLFGSDLYGPKLTEWKDYPAFIKSVLKLAHSTPVSADVPKDISIQIPRYQPDGLRIEVHNAAGMDAQIMVAYKVRNGEHGLLNSATQLVQVPHGQTVSVALEERSSELGTFTAPLCGDQLPFRHIQAACASTDRRHVLCESDRLVDVCPAVTLDLAGEDIRTFPELRSWAERDMGAGFDVAGGSTIPRYVYFKGATPTLNVSVRNGLHNIAPLATPADLNWNENPTVQGLNDLAFSNGGLRGFLPLFGVWSGKSAAEQRLALTWDQPVLIAGHRIVGNTSYRVWDRSNPKKYELLDAKGTVLTQSDKAEYIVAAHRADFAAVQTHSCQLHITGLDPAANLEPHILNDLPDLKEATANCSIVEWEVFGWPDEKPVAEAQGKLSVTLTELTTGKKTELLNQDLTIWALSARKLPVALPPCNSPGPVRVEALFTVAGRQPIHASFDCLIIEGDHKFIERVPQAQMGLLCSPGFAALDGFGTGTKSDVYGWGGPDDKIWAATHDMLEQTTRYDKSASHFFTTGAGFTHYTCPWREFPSGEYYWDVAATELEKMVQQKNFKPRTPGEFNLFLSDRWNGIPIYATMCWSDFIRFDEYLRSTGAPGLKGRGRVAIGEEISNEHGDEYQKWQMNRYADKLLDVQRRLSKYGLKFTVTTHGSFPLVGGELGAKIGKTHIASGTDVFWDTKNDDLYHTLGLRFGLIAANPDFESGAYNEWGWCSSALDNPHWFACSGAVEPARRQWYSTYFMGRITSAGTFEPLTQYGFYAQGGHGVKNTARDWQEYYRTQEFTTRVRPEQPCGVGLVVSWHTQERHLSPHSPDMGTGLFAGAGFDQIDWMAGAAYERLAKAGVPIEFVASTDTLKNWNGTQPLIVIDGYDLDPWEYDVLRRLNRAGTPIIAIGAGEREQPQAVELFGVKKSNQGWAAGPGINPIINGGETLAWTKTTVDQAPILFCPLEAKKLSPQHTAILAERINAMLGSPLIVPPGIVCIPFVSQDRLFLALNSVGDDSQNAEISLRPTLLDSKYTGQQFHVIDLDHAEVISSQWQHDRLTFSIPIAGTEGRMLMVVKE